MYVAQDANYSITALFDTSGNIVERYAYDPYGRATILAPDWSERAASLFAWQHLHQGLRFEPLTGLYHNRAREYSPTLMRFVSTDPIWATNLYAAYGNAPVGRVDPSGQGWFEFVTGAVTAVAVTAVVMTAVVVAGPVLLAAAATTAAVIGVSTTTVTTVATVTAVAVGAAATGKAGYEAATGKEAFTGRRLSDFERGFAF